MNEPAAKPRRTRRLLLAAGVLAVLGGGGFLAYQSPWVRSFFGRDAENAAEMERLGGAKLDPPAVAGADWPQWRGPLRDGRAPAGPLRTDWDKNPPKQLW